MSASAPQTSAGETRKLPGGALLRIERGTQYSLGRPIGVQLGSRPERTLAQAVILTSGRVDIELPEGRHGTAVIVQCPRNVSAVAKGGRSTVIANANQVTVAAISSEMLVAAGNRWRTLASGSVREFMQGMVMADHPMLAAPQSIQLSTRVALNINGSNVRVSANVSPVPKAVGYEFTLWRNDGDKPAVLRRLRTGEGQINFDPMVPGSYAVSVHALESSGLEGPESEIAPLRVLGAELPAGAKFSGGGILLAVNQRVSLQGTDGMEISYGNAPNFVAAPTTVGVIRNQTTVVRFRAQGSKDELAIRLLPLRVRADVQLGPARARWPHDEVTVSVRLTDGLGKPIGNDVALKSSVFVNVTPVAVDWKRDRNLLTASVPRGTQAGPWVVRVEVQDDSGTLVGRDFLEVAAAPPPHR